MLLFSLYLSTFDFHRILSYNFEEESIINYYYLDLRVSHKLYLDNKTKDVN